MKIDVTLVKILLALSSLSFFAMLGMLLLLKALDPPGSVLVTGIAASVSLLGFSSLFALWAYWIYHFWRTNQTTELLLCFLLPYIYAVYHSVKVVRASAGSPSAAGRA
jgi:hypothetical protein